MKALFILGISIALPIWVHTVTSPTFWATIPFGNKYAGFIKAGLGVATFILLSAVTSKKS
ncbi:MAG: hypothetical protein JXR78_14125 [Victivallales bacterium]|nr:hypothetical protein [Victivallales bacterium]